MRDNKSLAAWREGKQTVGAWLSLPLPHSAEFLANLGFDWVCVDLQHGLIDYTDLTRMLPAISTGDVTPIVRVPWNEPYEIMKALDAGAYGVIVPMVNNRSDAEAAVQACRYPPDGLRSFGPIRGALYGGRGYAAEANQQIACIVMLETKEGLDNLDDVVSTPGVDGVYIGPSDLALALGLPAQGDTDHAEHAAAVTRIEQSCRKHGVALGIHTSSPEYASRYIDRGFDFVTVGSDMGWLSRGAVGDLKAARAGAEARVENTGY